MPQGVKVQHWQVLRVAVRALRSARTAGLAYDWRHSLIAVDL
jgi:hypothetical protein